MKKVGWHLILSITVVFQNNSPQMNSTQNTNKPPPHLPMKPNKLNKSTAYEVRSEQSIELLQALHILTNEGKINQDSRRKLKQIHHLLNFIKPLLDEVRTRQTTLSVVDHGAGKSYLGFMLYDDYFKPQQLDPVQARVYGIETRAELVERSHALAHRAGFEGMDFLHLSVAESIHSPQLPPQVDVVTALHACDTATDDAIAFALAKNAEHIILVPCCQAEVARVLRARKGERLSHPLTELWRHPIHTREFAALLTNVLRGLQLQAHGYAVTVTELVGWEHSMKNELILASKKRDPHGHTRFNLTAKHRLHELLDTFGLDELNTRFFT